MNIKVGVVGLGAIGKTHAKILKNLGAEVAVYDIRLDAAKHASSELSLEYCSSLDELLSKVDAVYVCTPPFTHEEVIKRACEEEKHIFCEKPLCVTVEEAERIVDYVKKSGILFMMGFVLRFFPVYNKVKELSEKVGRIVNAWFFDIRPPYIKGIGGWRTKRKLNAGLFEQTVHEVDIIRWIVGEPVSVYCMGGRYVIEEFDYEDNMVYAMKTSKGALVTLISSITAKASSRDLGIVGTEGTILVRGGEIYFNENKVECRQWRPYEKEDKYFLECIEKGEKPFVNEIDGYRAQVINDASLKSMIERREIAIKYKY
ncbi:MAG: hypothetical protein DRN04_04540 [Thermoprotei archaeon]|nr:MAG: hypothetical protein DRN04_04540 [Thermoprotei archaeon]